MREPGPRHLRRSVDAAVRSGHLHYARWAEIDDLLLDERSQEASDLFSASVAAEPIYAGVLGGQDRWKLRETEVATITEAEFGKECPTYEGSNG